MSSDIKLQQLIMYPCGHRIAVYSNRPYQGQKPVIAYLGCPQCNNFTNLETIDKICEVCYKKIPSWFGGITCSSKCYYEKFGRCD